MHPLQYQYSDGCDPVFGWCAGPGRDRLCISLLDESPHSGMQDSERVLPRYFYSHQLQSKSNRWNSLRLSMRKAKRPQAQLRKATGNCFTRALRNRSKHLNRLIAGGNLLIDDRPALFKFLFSLLHCQQGLTFRAAVANRHNDVMRLPHDYITVKIISGKQADLAPGATGGSPLMLLITSTN